MNIVEINALSDRVLFGVFLLLGLVALWRLPWRGLWDWAGRVSPSVLDGLLYTSWAMLTAVLTYFSGEEAYKYVDPWVLFYMKAILGSLTAGIGALKAFRSQSYKPNQTS